MVFRIEYNLMGSKIFKLKTLSYFLHVGVQFPPFVFMPQLLKNLLQLCSNTVVNKRISDQRCQNMANGAYTATRSYE